MRELFGSTKWENEVDHPRCSVEQYLREDYESWPGDWEGDFNYVDGRLERHDFGDLGHGEMHERLIGHFSEQGEKSKNIILPSFTLQITPTRFRVPDLVLFDRSIPRKEITKTSASWNDSLAHWSGLPEACR
jgi:hypothetical protein